MRSVKSSRPRRPYRLGRRAATAEATRLHIVETTLRLHDEQGITNTSVRDVAARAGISAATVLNHFPRMPDLIRACGALSDARYPMPSPAVLEGSADAKARLRRATQALFDWWEPMASGWEHLQVDRRTIPEVDAWLRETDIGHRRLIAAALGEPPHHRRVAIATALTTFGAWRSLREAGMTNRGAASAVVRTLLGQAARIGSRT